MARLVPILPKYVPDATRYVPDATLGALKLQNFPGGACLASMSLVACTPL